VALSKSVPVFLYHFTFAAPNWVDQWLLGDYHSSELEFVFNNPWPPLVHDFDPEDTEMAAALGAYWTNFAASGTSPNKGPAGGLLAWPQFSSDILMNMNIPLAVENGYLDNICDFWDTITVANQ